MTLEERNAKRAEIVRRCGMDYSIQESQRDAIRAIVDPVWEVQREEFTTHRLAFYVMPKAGTTLRRIADAESELSRVFGNPPHTMGTRFSMYTLEFFPN